MKVPSSETNLNEQVLLAQCLIKFCPSHQLTNKFVISIFKKDSFNKSVYSSLMKCAINTAQNFIRNKQKQAKSQKNREKASMSLQATEENLIALKDTAEQNRNAYSQRLRKEFDAKLYQILLTLSSLTKLNEDYLLIMMNTDVQKQINLELREKTPEEKQQAIFMGRVNPNIIKRMSDPISLQTLFEFYRVGYLFFSAYPEEGNRLFALSDQIICNLQQKGDKVLISHKISSDTTIYFFDGIPILTRSLVSSDNPVLQINNERQVFINKNISLDENCVQMLEVLLKKTTLFYSQDERILVELITYNGTLGNLNKIKETLLNNVDNLFDLIDSVENTEEKVIVKLKDKTIIQITKLIESDTIDIINWLAVLSLDFLGEGERKNTTNIDDNKNTSNLQEEHEVFMTMGCCNVRAMGINDTMRLYSLIEELVHNGGKSTTKKLIKSQRHNNSQVTLTFEEGLTLLLTRETPSKDPWWY